VVASVASEISVPPFAAGSTERVAPPPVPLAAARAGAMTSLRATSKRIPQREQRTRWPLTKMETS
jgi:hypothetical protein